MFFSRTGSQSSAGHQPGTPTIGTATAGNAQATITFTAPAYLGKPTGTTYRAFTQPVAVRSTTGTVANNIQIGSIWRADITGMSSTANLFVNQIITATAGTGSLGAGTVTISSFTSATSMVVESTATMTNGTITNILGGIFGTGSTSPVTVTGLTNGTSYSFRVQLDNAVTTSLISGVSNSVTPVIPGPFFPPPAFPFFPPPYFKGVITPPFFPPPPYFKTMPVIEEDQE